MKNKKNHLAIVIAGVMLVSNFAQAAIGLDRTRVIFDGSQKSISLNVSNNNKNLPYLAQGWIDNAEGVKITSPLVVLPPVQRIEPGKASQIKIEALPAINSLPQDRETLYYFNLREIPPKSDKANTLQIALQTRVKLFYRPKSIVPPRMGTPWQEKLVIQKQGEAVTVKNPTPYYVTVINMAANENALKSKMLTPFMIAPFGEHKVDLKASALGNQPLLSYINDFGGRPALKFQCSGSQCLAVGDSK